MDILNVFLIFVNFYVYLYISYKLLNYKFTFTFKTNLEIIIISIFYGTLSKFLTLHFFKISITFICLFILLYKSIDGNFYFIVQICFFTILIAICSEQITAILFIKFLNKNFQHIVTSKQLLFMCNLLIMLINILIINIKHLFCKTFEYLLNSNISDYTIYNIFTMVLISAVVFSYSSICSLFFKYFNDNSFLIIIILCTFFIFIFLMFTYVTHLYSKNLEISKINEKKYKQLQIYSKSIENLIDDISSFKHDYNNIIFMMNGFLENNDFENLKQYFHTNVFSEKNYYDISKLKKIKNSGIKGLLAAKISSILKYDIKVNIEIFNTITDIYINELDLCRIIGVFLDNALESALNSKEKFISISLTEDNGLNIVILNSCDNDICINSIFKKGYSSKGTNRGIGLYNVRSILNEKYPQNTILNTYIHNNMFIQDLYIKTK